MITHEINVRTLTPVWTGSADGTPDGLKISGVIGSMRMIFEALVRRNGGHTCDITGPAQNRCIKNRDNLPICPACAIFGCTGLSRSFKIDWPLPRIGNIILPTADTCGELANRDHSKTIYTQKSGLPDTLIAKWLTATISADKDLAKNSGANDWSKVQPAYSPDPSTIRVTQLRRVEINEQPLDVPKIIAGLLTFMARRYGIGAKVNQGWGLFSVADDCQVNNKNLSAEIKALCNGYHPSRDHWDNGMPDARAFGAYHFATDEDPDKDRSMSFFFKKQKIGAGAERTVDNFGFEWPSDPAVNNFICLGYALKYRLRRMVKFAETLAANADNEDAKNAFDAINDLARQWARDNASLVEKYKRVPWRENGAFAEHLFGAAASENDDRYGAGLIGVSHLYRTNKKSGWSMRLLTQCPNDDYNNAIVNLLLQIRREAL